MSKRTTRIAKLPARRNATAKALATPPTALAGIATSRDRRRGLRAALLAGTALTGLVIAGLPAAPARAAAFVVTNISDSGAGSLRAAIDSANLSVDPTNTISFAPALAGGTITLASSLPSISNNVALGEPRQRRPHAWGAGGMANRRARQLRSALTDAERKLWLHLRRRRIDGHRFRRQAPFGPYIVDFACLSARLIVEVDGGQHTDQSASDARRTAWLESQGFRVMRFWNNEVLGDIDGVLGVIADALDRRRNPPPAAQVRPTTSPARREVKKRNSGRLESCLPRKGGGEKRK